MARKIQVEIVGDASQLERAFGRAAKSGSKFERGLSKASKVAAGALVGLGAAAKFGLDELMEAERVGKQTAAVLKSTGGAANVSQRQIEKLAGSLSELSGVDDEAIQSGQNLLLTFTKVRNEVGKGNAVFNRATKATLDMSIALGTDMKSAALQVGKALNDPLKGVTALQRAGVSFTAQQREQIKTLVESGRTLEAQKLILSELETQFGGSAKAAGETFAGQIDKLKNSLAETAAELVAALLPALKTLAGHVAVATKWMQENQGVVKVAAVAIAGLSAGILALNGVVKVTNALLPVLKVAWAGVNLVMAGNPIALVTLALVALGVAIVVVWKRSETFRTVVTGAFNAIRAVITGWVSWNLRQFSFFLAGVKAIADVMGKLPGPLGAPFRAAAEAAGNAKARVDALDRSIRGLPPEKTITITTVFRQVGSATSSVGGAIAAAGRRAHGGPVSRGLSYLVGERGPEMFTPNTSGMIIPNHRLAGAGPIVVRNVVELDGRVVAESTRKYKTRHERLNGKGSW